MYKTIAAAAILAGFRFPVAFDNKAGWKLDKDGKIEMKDGNPVYLDAGGNEMTVAGDTISRLNGEAKQHREVAAGLIEKLEKYKGADGKHIDPAIAIKAIETVGKIDAKKLIDAGEVDKVRDAVKAEFAGQLTEKDAKITELTSTNKTMLVDKVFDSSTFVRNRVAVPPDMFRDSFGKNVKVADDGKLEFYGRDGNKLMSKKNVGEYATGDEAFELMIEQHPQKDTIMKAADASGSGNNGGGGARGGGRFMSRAEFEKLDPGAAAAAAASMAKGELTVS